ncbi:MAG: ABC transporter ATP-binding protein [Anaerolineales bacterium]|nr:ABC transporter ATP-binding protein [Anaerolineales bacterium]
MWSLIRQFARFYRPYRRLFLLDFCCAVGVASLEISFPIVVNYVIDTLLPRLDWGLIVAACAGLFAVYALTGGLQFIVSYWGHMLGISIETDMRRMMFMHLQKLSFRFYDNHKTGHLMSRISTDLFDIGEVAHHGPEDVFIAGVTLIATFVVMLTVHAPLAVLTFLVSPVLIWLGLHFNTRMTRAFQGMYAAIGNFNARVEDNLSGIRVVQAFANEAHETALFSADNRAFKTAKLAAYKIMAWSNMLSYLSRQSVTLLVLLAGAWLIFKQQLTTGQFIAFLLLTTVLFRPIEKINAVVDTYPKGIAGFKRFLELMATEPEVVDAPAAVAVERLRGDIRFEAITFAYEPGRPVMAEVNLNIRAGETIALVGPSGAGKTTLCSLLPRFYDVTAGRITIDGLDVRAMTLASLRQQIGIVQQDVFLFNGSIRDNIAYGQLGAGEADLWLAAERAHLAGFIRSLPQGLETLIGERGVKLSGGQKQRMAIARMFLKNPPILILDEATSALDSETERYIQQSLAELSAGRTTLVIAHRLATIRNADRILVVTEQGLAEQGTHQELLNLSGLYARMHQAQFGEWALAGETVSPLPANSEAVVSVTIP